MTRPPASLPPADPAEAAQEHQATIALAAVAAVHDLWPTLDLADLKRTLPAYKAQATLAVHQHALAAAGLAVHQYAGQRSAAGVTSTFRPLHAAPPPLPVIDGNLAWATAPLWNSNVLAAATGGIEKVTATKPAASSAIAEAKARLAATASGMVGDTGARTILDNAVRDPKARGYARVPEAGACAFCLMLASRAAGPRQVLYKTAGQRQSSARTGKAFLPHADVPSSVKVHDHCRCHVEPVFGLYEPTARVRAANALWASSTQGHSGQDAINAFRRAVDEANAK